jgi:hypothetical protein
MIKKNRPQQLNKGLNPPDPWNKIPQHSSGAHLCFAQAVLVDESFLLVQTWYGYETRFPKDKFLKKVQEGTKLQIPKDIIWFKKNQVGYKRVPSTRFPRESLMCNGQQCIDVHINTLSTVSGDIFFFSLKLAIACSDRP